ARGSARDTSRPSLCEHLLGLLNSADELVNFLGAVIDVKAGSGGSSNAQAVHEGLRTVVSRADRDPFAVDQRGQVVGMDVRQRKRDGAPVQLGVTRPVYSDTGNFLKLLHRVVDEGPFVPSNVVHPELAEVIHGGPEPDAFCDAGRAGLELPGQVVPARLGEL